MTPGLHPSRLGVIPPAPVPGAIVDENRAVLKQLMNVTREQYSAWLCLPCTKGHLRLFDDDRFENTTISKWYWPPVCYCVLALALVVGLFWNEATRVDPWRFARTFAGGWITWWIMEYFIHRYVFHTIPPFRFLIPYHFLFHGIHHKTPKDASRLVFHPIVSLVGSCSLFLLASPFLRTDALLAGTAGCALNYGLVYETVHYMCHHVSIPSRRGERFYVPLLSRYLRWTKGYHNKHHYSDETRNFCISFNPLDRVLGTVGTARTWSPCPAVAHGGRTSLFGATAPVISFSDTSKG